VDVAAVVVHGDDLALGDVLAPELGHHLRVCSRFGAVRSDSASLAPRPPQRAERGDASAVWSLGFRVEVHAEREDARAASLTVAGLSVARSSQWNPRGANRKSPCFHVRVEAGYGTPPFSIQQLPFWDIGLRGTPLLRATKMPRNRMLGGTALNVQREELALAAPAAVVAFDRGILAVPGPKGDVLVYNTRQGDAPPEMLTGIHSSAVTALCLSWRPWPCLYTAAADGIARWSLEFVAADAEAPVSTDAAWQQESEFSSELLTGDLERAPAHIAVDGGGNRLAVCVNRCALITSCTSGKLLARLEGHNAPVTSAAFRSDHPDSVITIGEDRRFIVYDLKAACILYGSCIVSSSPFISLATEDGGSRCALGSSDGKVRVYDLATPDCRLLHTVDIPQTMGTNPQPWLKRPRTPAGSPGDAPVIISCEPAWKRAIEVPDSCLAEDEEDGECGNTEGSCAIALAFLRPSTRPRARQRTKTGADGAARQLILTSPL